jgi:hypothetical protein
MMDAVAANMGALYVQPSQGSYNRGGVAASAGTHDGGGAVDIIVGNLTAATRQRLVREMRRVGFAAWLRTPAQSNWPYHVHAIAVQPGGKNDQGVLSTGAHAQVVDYYNGRNGLARHALDDGPRDYVGVTWETYQPIQPDPEPEPPTLTERIKEYGMLIAQSQHNKDHKYLIGPASARKLDAQTLHNLRKLGVPEADDVVTDESIRFLSDTGTAAGGVAAPGVDTKTGPG